jgi:hypothetical protein
MGKPVFTFEEFLSLGTEQHGDEVMERVSV